MVIKHSKAKLKEDTTQWNAMFCFTKANGLEVNELKMVERLSGMLVGDKGYVSQEWEKHY